MKSGGSQPSAFRAASNGKISSSPSREVCGGSPQSVVQLDRRRPTQQPPGERDVGLALHRIVGRQGPMLDPRRRAGDGDDPFGHLLPMGKCLGNKGFCGKPASAER